MGVRVSLPAPFGSVTEWLMVPVLKTGGGAEPSVGSNPTAPAICGYAGIGRQAGLRCLCPSGRVGSSPTIRTRVKFVLFDKKLVDVRFYRTRSVSVLVRVKWHIQESKKSVLPKLQKKNYCKGLIAANEAADCCIIRV